MDPTEWTAEEYERAAIEAALDELTEDECHADE